MDIYFKNSYLERIYRGLSVPGKPKYDEKIIRIFRQRIRLLASLDSTKELRQFKSLHFEALKGDKKGLFSIRIDLKYRLEFYLEQNRITLKEIIFIEDLSNHYK